MTPRAIACLLAVLITLPLADSVFQVPIQVSDSLEPIVISAKYSTTSRLLQDSVRFSPTTFRPMRYLQARWLLHAADASGQTYNAVFRGVHVLLLMLLVALFVLAVDVRTWTDLAAFSIAFPVFIGIHTFVAMLQEAFPVNHYAEVGIGVLAVLVLARRAPRPYVAPIICALLAFGLSVIESGALVWVTVLCCAAVGMRGITRTTVVSTTVLIGAYLVLRQALRITTPGIGGHGSGFGGTFYSPEELVQRFGAHPVGFMAYNVVGGLASLLFSEPRQGVYSLLPAWREGALHPVLGINLLSSVVTTALLIWYGITHLRAGRAAWSDRDRLFLATCAVMVANAALTLAYIKDEIISPGGLCYAIAAFIAVGAMVESLPRRTAAVASVMALLLVATAALWTFRAAGVHYVLRYDAFKIRNDWVEVLREDKRGDWPADPGERALTQRIRDEAIVRRVASPSFMPRWADRYWVE
jgi:hypothetical protein